MSRKAENPAKVAARQASYRGRKAEANQKRILTRYVPADRRDEIATKVNKFITELLENDVQ